MSQFQLAAVLVLKGKEGSSLRLPYAPNSAGPTMLENVVSAPCDKARGIGGFGSGKSRLNLLARW